MTGVGYGYGLAVEMALLLFFYTPFITTMLMITTDFFKRLSFIKRVLGYIIVFIFVAILTGLHLRLFPYSGLDGLFVFDFIITVAVVILLPIKFINKIK